MRKEPEAEVGEVSGRHPIAFGDPEARSADSPVPTWPGLVRRLASFFSRNRGSKRAIRLDPLGRFKVVVTWLLGNILHFFLIVV